MSAKIYDFAAERAKRPEIKSAWDAAKHARINKPFKPVSKDEAKRVVARSKRQGW